MQYLNAVRDAIDVAEIEDKALLKKEVMAKAKQTVKTFAQPLKSCAMISES
jgi:hypothetical protein